MTITFNVEKLDKRHDRANFESSSPFLTNYFRTQARQDVDKHSATCYVALSCSNGALIGFYTLACGNIVLDSLSPADQKKLPSYPVVPAILLGRLAISATVEKQGVGTALLVDALIRAYELSEQVASFAVVVDAIDEKAKGFYKHVGFSELTKEPMRLIMPMGTIKKMFAPGA